LLGIPLVTLVHHPMLPKRRYLKGSSSCSLPPSFLRRNTFPRNIVEAKINRFLRSLPRGGTSR
jgi:hypothetical protein